MLKKLMGCVREYKKVSKLTPILMIGEVVMECLIPFVIAKLVGQIEAGCEFTVIVKYGLILFAMACVSMFFGGLAGMTGSKASCGFARNLRHDLYYRIQEYSFENIDKFSASSLVTRLTTDVANVQMSFMMLIRIAIRSPLMFIFAIVMAFIMGGKMALMFVVVVPILGFGLFTVAKKAMPLFRSVFRKYDNLNASIQENVKGMRVVKSFVREEYEKEKFNRAAEDVCMDFTKAERIVAINGPLMQFCLYANMMLVLSFGSYLVISSKGSAMGVGQLSAMITYGFMVLSSLMMLSMIFVMLTISAESAERIVEVLEDQPSLTNPANPV
ncbi:MAG: ABC transporter ATP-binding protein, partial [Lachnospiraceae bacterium]|nr:ABC transporter ATP-binding protein [Lachnospiraceae bacterium]